ncbi:D-3-phosphoglycerate dehydrogenase [Gluconacetobacter johannae DSM 13595]|uniref:Glyoxylate/hydroxypyruvate reductase A n=1 Tax=Gluconacetobacter johannae TaxID=112140 RepID=A0A7W4P4U6_9PROT|nr:glyoxylate/hydroxypyruvate reductase A [Gluconacetobacter johannae]MBB2175468.1 glyoxylate/hydroxypyruvate reductase A [Gluconacetobacter johannae]GBQ89002.1 D-3-phosphoglycerate dehydrogenase [Gluconacetobacter johannae DSM 13595]
MSLVIRTSSARSAAWRSALSALAPDLDVRIWPDVGDPAAVTHLLTWKPPSDLMTRFPNLRAVFSEGAGVDQFLSLGLPDGVSLVRIVDPALTDMMVEYGVWATLALHRQAPAYRRSQAAHEWRPQAQPLARDRRVGVLGLGVLGAALLRRLHLFGFACAGWSRGAHAIDGVTCFAGHDTLAAFLHRTDILICLLPLTDETRGILSARTFAALPQGAGVINCGRGGHVVEADLLAALESGHLSHAILDVAGQEPLPADHPFWDHPGITLTPHVASDTTPASAAHQLVDNLRRLRAGQTPVGLVDRGRGY